MNTQSIIVPKLSTVPVHEARARAILRWLVREKVVEEQLTTCGRTGNRRGHALAEGARKVALHPEKLPFGEQVNGLEVMLKRCIYTPTEGFLEEAGCPECRREVGEPLFESLEEWMPAVSVAPSCGVRDGGASMESLISHPSPTGVPNEIRSGVASAPTLPGWTTAASVAVAGPVADTLNE